jgi:hypothetical protein
MASPQIRRTLDFNDALGDYEIANNQQRHTINGSTGNDNTKNNTRRNRVESWPGGTFRPEVDTPKPLHVPFAQMLQEESMTITLYVLGSALLHMIFKCIMGTDTPPHVNGASSICNSLEYFLQAVWLYHTSRPTTANNNKCQPILSARLACWRLGRLQDREILLISCIHAGLIFLFHALLSPLSGSETVSSFSTTNNFLRSTLQMAGCVIVLFVIPVFLEISRLHPGLVILLLRPPFLNSLTTTGSIDASELILQQVLAGLLAGKVLELYFPDDPLV